MIHLWVDNFWLGQDTSKTHNLILKSFPAFSKGTSSKSKVHNNPVLLWINRFHFNACNQILFNYYFKLFQLNFCLPIINDIYFNMFFFHIHSFTMISQASPDGFFSRLDPLGRGCGSRQGRRQGCRSGRCAMEFLGSRDQLGPWLFSR